MTLGQTFQAHGKERSLGVRFKTPVKIAQANAQRVAPHVELSRSAPLPLTRYPENASLPLIIDSQRFIRIHEAQSFTLSRCRVDLVMAASPRFKVNDLSVACKPLDLVQECC